MFWRTLRQSCSTYLVRYYMISWWILQAFLELLFHREDENPSESNYQTTDHRHNTINSFCVTWNVVDDSEPNIQISTTLVVLDHEKCKVIETLEIIFFINVFKNIANKHVSTIKITYKYGVNKGKIKRNWEIFILHTKRRNPIRTMIIKTRDYS